MGKKSASEPKDYTQDKAAFAKSEAATRQKQAATYNEKVGNYNASLAQINNSLSNLGDTFKQYDITDSSKFSSGLSRLSDLENAYNTLNSGYGSGISTPEWNSVVQSAYGPVEVGIPTLSKQNTTMSNQIASQISSLRSMIDNLSSERKAEENRINSYSNDLRSQLSSLGSNINGYGIADLAGINAAKSQLASLGAGLSGFSSAILGQYAPNLAGQYTTQMAGLNGQLDALLAQRSTEQNRINSYEASMNSNYDKLLSQFNGLSIADLSGMTSLQQAIDAQQLAAGRFSSQLGFDFNDELSPYSDLESRLGQLQSQREAELSRVSSAQSSAQQGISNILSQLGGADIYNLGSLNQIGTALSQGRRDISGFSSVLGSDFSGVLSQMDQADAQLKALRDQRANALSGYSTNANALLGRINGLDLSNENGLQTGLYDAQSLLSQLGAFSGTDTADTRNLINSVVSAAQGRINDLSTERGSIESSARQLLNNAQGTQYTTTGALDDLAAQLRAITTRQGTYGATQAQDEVDAINALIGSERTRIKTDADAAAAAQKKEQEDYLAYLTGGQGYGSYYGSYSPWLTGSSAYRLRPGDLPSSFARQLQAVYA